MKRQAGFSLIELMTVIGIIAILAAIATPNVFVWAANSRFNRGVRDVQAAVQNMRLFALKENSLAKITFTSGASSTYQTDKWKRGLGAAAHQIETRSLPPGVTVSYANSAGGELIFNSRGMATAPPQTIRVTGQDGKFRDIIVNLTGRTQIG